MVTEATRGCPFRCSYCQLNVQPAPFRKRPIEDVLLEDLIPHVDATYRTIARRESRGIEGMSMGGYGALRLALRHPTRFSSVLAEPRSTRALGADRRRGVPRGGACFGEELRTQHRGGRRAPAPVPPRPGEGAVDDVRPPTGGRDRRAELTG